LEGRSFECYLTGEIGTAFQTRQQAAAIWKSLQRSEKEGDNLRWLSRLAWFSGKRKEAERYAQEAVEILEKLPPGPELAMVYSNKSQLHVLSEEIEPARDWGERAIQLASRLDASEILVHALTNVGTAEIMAGEETGWERITQALGIARQKELHDDVGRAYANLASLAIQRRQYGRAAAWLDEGLPYMEEHDLDSYRVYLLGWRARLYLETGRWPLAEADATRALGLQTGASVIPIPAMIALGHLKVRRGDADATAWLEKASSLSLPTGELQRIGPLAAARAEAAWWSGEPDQVEAVTLPGYKLALQHPDPWILGQLAYWLWRSGRMEISLERLAHPYQLMIQGEWQAAAQVWKHLGCPFELALALSEGDPASQIEALSIFEQLGARPAAEMLKNLLRQQGIKGIPRGPRPATRRNLAGLTNREVEVLTLVAEGLSNAGIADRLSISKKTVDHHMSALLRKLDADTRSQALAIAHRQGLLP
jgi:ATP/maltotriose-dependent transcriptional regulator MalT